MTTRDHDFKGKVYREKSKWGKYIIVLQPRKMKIYFAKNC